MEGGWIGGWVGGMVGGWKAEREGESESGIDARTRGREGVSNLTGGRGNRHTSWMHRYVHVHMYDMQG